MLKIGSVEFLNAKPLNYGFINTPSDEFDLILDTPANLAAMLKEKVIDVGLIPVMEYLNGVGKFIIGDSTIASRGPVGSVFLLRREDTFNFTNIVVDIRSKSSAALLRILLLEKGVSLNNLTYYNPELIYPSWVRADAKLIIGDQALFHSKNQYTLDLGEWWFNYTGLPFVFAVWVSNIDLSAVQINMFKDSKKMGVENLEKIILTKVKYCRITEEKLREYYTKRLVFDLGEKEIAGIKKFQDLLIKHRLIGEKRDIEIKQ
jgi:chorismate dehydratase